MRNVLVGSQTMIEWALLIELVDEGVSGRWSSKGGEGGLGKSEPLYLVCVPLTLAALMCVLGDV
jgi:hypothetical protein